VIGIGGGATIVDAMGADRARDDRDHSFRISSSAVRK
jgi:hypothetical protein